MPSCVVGGVTIPIAHGGVAHHYEEYGGDEVRMEDGSLRSTRKGFKSAWELRTPLISAANLATYEAAVDAAAPITCSGDALGASFSCAATKVAADRVESLATVFYILHFRLRQI